METAKKHSILIVDDENSSINILAHILRLDYTIYTAKDGITGLEIANEYLPDLILLDIIMPVMDGKEVLAKLKATEKTKNIPVIFVTGLETGENMLKKPDLEIEDYIRKPFNASDVREKVERQFSALNINAK